MFALLLKDANPWKNLLFLSPSFSHIHLDLCLHIISSSLTSLQKEMLYSFVSNCDSSKDDNLTKAKISRLAFVWNTWKERNHQIFRNSAWPWPWQSTLKDILNHTRSRAIFPNMDISSNIAASCDLLPPNSQTVIEGFHYQGLPLF